MEDRLPEIALPAWIECLRAVENGSATALHRFIAEQEPAAPALREAFRFDLRQLLDETERRCRGA